MKTENAWFTKMKEADRVRHLQRFATFKLPETLAFEESVSFSSRPDHCDVSTSNCGSVAQSGAIGLSLDKDSFEFDSYSEPGCSYSFHSVSSQSESNLHTHSEPSSLQCAGGLSSFAVSDSSGDEDTVPPPRKLGARRQLFPPKELSVNYMEFTKQVSVPESIWKKASRLLTTPNAIASAPGLDLKSHSVMSSSGQRPHLVSTKKTGQYICDKACGNWNSLSICSHTVAIAETNGELPKFVSWFIKAKKKPSVTKLVVTGMPTGRGRKGGKTTQYKKKALPTTSRTLVSLPCGTTTGVSNPSRPSSNSMPIHPPPLIHFTPQSPSPISEPFLICFISGNMSVCYGCRQKYPKPCVPPNDLCVQHKEWREFFTPGSGTAQARFGNVYYHCNVPCIQARCPFFSSRPLQIPALVAVQLLPVHTEFLAVRMGRTTAVHDE